MEPQSTTQTVPDVQQDAATALTLHRRALPALTGVRFFAAMQVVMFHFGAGFAERHGAPAVLHRMLANGFVAVTLFFILSGFILSYTYAGQIDLPRGRVRFWEARFARIYPVYLLSLLLCWPSQVHPRPGISLAVFTMVQQWNPLHPEYGGYWNMPAWTLSTEAFFYLVFPFLLPFLERLSTRVLKTLVVMFVVLIVLGHSMTPSIERLTTITLVPLPVFRFPEFLAGMLMGVIYLRSDRWKTWALTPYVAIAGMFAILLFISGPWLSLLAIPYAILIYDLATNPSAVSRLFGTGRIVLLGGASYAIYLLQEPVRSWLHRLFRGSWNPTVDRGGLDALLAPVVLVLVSVLVFLFWEEPARKWLRMWFKKRLARKAAVAV